MSESTACDLFSSSDDKLRYMIEQLYYEISSERDNLDLMEYHRNHLDEYEQEINERRPWKPTRPYKVDDAYITGLDHRITECQNNINALERVMELFCAKVHQ